MPTATPTSQHGAALITGLIFLVVLTLITLSATKSTSLEERMAGNARDQGLAFQAAEAGIRDAIATHPGLSPSNFAPGCAAGLCSNNATTPVWTTIANWASSPTLAYSGTINGVATQPHYIIELLPPTVPPSGFSLKPGTSLPNAYRITSHGWGMTTQAQATVQVVILN